MNTTGGSEEEVVTTFIESTIWGMDHNKGIPGEKRIDFKNKKKDLQSISKGRS
jgi:hypothetical protein